jgi:hypothetical protein
VARKKADRTKNSKPNLSAFIERFARLLRQEVKGLMDRKIEILPAENTAHIVEVVAAILRNELKKNTNRDKNFLPKKVH